VVSILSSSSVCVEETEISKSGSLTKMLLLLCPGMMAGGGAVGAYLISCVSSQRIGDQLRRGRLILFHHHGPPRWGAPPFNMAVCTQLVVVY
jgi:hypothetical protein